MLEAMGQGFLTILEPSSLAIILIGTLVGLLVGLVPIIGAMLVIALLLPFAFTMPPVIALLLLVCLSAVGNTTGSISAILLAVPGTSLAAATILDGFPMTRKGQGSKAIGAAVMSSMAGGIVVVPIALVMIPLIRPLVLAFTSSEMTMIILLGLTFIATLTGRSKIKGMISGLFGVLLATIGYHAVTAIPRFTFNTLFLYGGLGLIPVLLGIFGIAEMLDMLTKGGVTIAHGARVQTKLSDVWQGAKEVLRYKLTWLRSTLFGYIAGAIPGVGGMFATFGAYGFAKQHSKHPELFGTGIVEGVIAPESANNSKEAGGLLTTMAFGIPGTPIMALFIAAFIIVGIEPGPVMMNEELPMVFTLLIGLALANFIAGVITLSTAHYMARVSLIPFSVLFPMILVLIFMGVFASGLQIVNIVVVFLFGVLGFIMMRLDYSRPALTLGFVMGGLFEHHLQLATAIHGPSFFVRPISLAILALIILPFAYPLLKKAFSTMLRRRVKPS